MIVDKYTSKDPTFHTVQSLDGGTRKAYQQPQILSREPLEAMASTCTGNAGAKGAMPCTATKS